MTAHGVGIKAKPLRGGLRPALTHETAHAPAQNTPGKQEKQQQQAP
jgi:hypothetical protein